MSDLKRSTKSTHRQRQAQVTRKMIVTAAQELFLEQGYICTTMEIIADRAGVATSTVYAVFGSKRGILRAIREDWHEHSHIREITYNSNPASAPDDLLDSLAKATAAQWESGAVVIAIYTGAAAADPLAAAELAQTLTSRREGLQYFARTLEPHLLPGMDVAHAAALLQALCLPEVYDELVRHSGWAVDEYQHWLGITLKRELLGAKEG